MKSMKTHMTMPFRLALPLLLALMGSFPLAGTGQGPLVLTLDSCQVLARMNYPLIRQFDLIRQTASLQADNASKGKLPQLNLSAQVSYQSDVTSVPLTLPNVDIPSPSKDQYNLYAEANQSINEWYTTKNRIALLDANARVDQQKNEVELYQLRNRINQLYFGILIYNAQLEQVELLRKDIQTGINKTQAAVANGTAIKSHVTQLQAELLKADQRAVELAAGKQAFLDVLSTYIHQPLDAQTVFQNPVSPTLTDVIRRPELTLFDNQRHTFDLQDRLLRIDNLPRFSVFLRAGIGKPGLNALAEDFDFYYMGGIRVNWNLSGRYTLRHSQEILTLNQQMIDLQRETFLVMTACALQQQEAELQKYKSLIETDEAILALRREVTLTAAAQLENGTATVNDYITYVNAEDQARQNLALHQVQLQLAQYNYLTTTGQ